MGKPSQITELAPNPLSRDRGKLSHAAIHTGSKSSEPYAPNDSSSVPLDTLPQRPTEVASSSTSLLQTPTGTRANRSLHPEIQTKRKEFRENFHSDIWNCPSKEYDSDVKDQLSGRKALVIAIQYAAHSNWLPGTFADALRVANMLQTKYGYHPKCIRVLADQVNTDNRKDRKRWPTKNNIMEGLRWLGEDCPDNFKCRRFLYFSGFGYLSESGNVAEGNQLNMPAIHSSQRSVPGIAPVDYENDMDYHGTAISMDPETVILDWELNNCLVDSLDGKEVKLSAVFDCCFGKNVSNYQREPMGITRIRGRHLFHNSAVVPGGSGTIMDYIPSVGNILNLPVKIELGSLMPVSSNTAISQVESKSDTDGRDPGQKGFKPFPESCQVICWATSEVAAEDFAGGWFTSAFIKALNQAAPSEMCRYRDLSKYIRIAFDEFSEAHPDNLGARQTGSVKRTVIDYFYPNQYVSQNVVDDLADALVEL
ncbi:Ca(2+)-dependent cysteine protease [Ceratobasidium sp. 428]|nr:Ca(2+)-dependent cysteine protease [Ceratobasidium sp. 428]